MTKVRNGMPVPRHQVLLLDDGNPAVLWAEERVQELQSGRFHEGIDLARARSLLDDELHELASLGIIEDYSDQFVWLMAMHVPRESPDDVEMRALAEAAGKRVFIVYTTLLEDQVEQVRTRLDKSPLKHEVEVLPLNGLTAIVGRAGKPFATVGEADHVLQIVLRLGAQFADSAVVFQDGRDGRKSTNEMVAAVLNEPEAELSFDELAASQMATEATAGKRALLVVHEPHFERVAFEALGSLNIEPLVIGSDAALRQALAESPALLMCDMAAIEQIGSQWLVDLLSEYGRALPVLVLANPAQFDPDAALILKNAGVGFVLDFPLSASKLRLHIYEVLHHPQA
ncbi:MAG: hypothetical protein KME04_00400 [Pleurocapsa minor GSE-CHR-MK-17-07R]|nr:hypothetical protein [Pleurocapsa minor GSE-CHR-MK 17-07R]